MKFGSILCLVVELVLCDNGIFVNDGIEDIIFTFFKKENSKILDAPLSSDSEIDTALFKMQENIDGYIDYFCKQIPIYIRQTIKDVTDKNLPKDFNINTSSPTEYLIKNCDIERLEDIINFFYCSKINELRSIIAFYFYNIALDVPNFGGLFNVTFFEDNFFHIDIKRTSIIHFANKAVEIAASKTSLSKEFDDYFNDNIVSRFNKMIIYLKDKVLYMIRIFQINKRLIKNSTSNKFSILNVANYTENKPSGMYKADIISYLKKLMDDIENCKKILETKSYDNLLDMIKTEFIYIKKNVKLLTTDERFRLMAFTKTKSSNNIQTFYDEIKVIAETFGQYYKSLDEHILKLGDEKIAKLKECLITIYVEIQSSAYNNKLLVENIIEEISDKITSKKEVISRKDLEKYILTVDHSIDYGKTSIINVFFDFEYEFKKFYDYVYVYFDCDKICLHGLDIASTEILLKINEVYEFIHTIWKRKIFFYGTIVNSYLLMLFICKDGNLIDVRYQNIYNKNKHSLSIVRNQVRDNFNNLVDAFDKTGNFFLSIFETNYLNEIPFFKQLFSNRLALLMNTYKSRIESINKLLETNDNMPNLNKQFFDATSSSSTNLYVKAYEFTPHQHALRVYEQLYQQKNENKKIKNNYELIVYIGNKDINNNNGYNGLHNNGGNNSNNLSNNSIGSGNNGHSRYYNGISNSLDNNANNDITSDKNRNTGNGALNTKANNIPDKDDQNTEPTPATYNKNNASVTNYQVYIFIGVVGFSVVIVSATIIAIIVKKRYFD